MIIKKIIKVANEHYLMFKNMKQEFGIPFALRAVIYSSVWRAFDICSGWYINNNLRQLKKDFKLLIDKYNSMPEENNNEQTSKIIWVCWWQGVGNMPELCQFCFQHLLNNTPSDYIVNVVTEQNYANFVSLPPEIVDKYNKGIIKIQQFSDILRQALLWQKGGVWLDATLFTLPGYLDNIDFSKQFWSINLGRIVKKRQIGQILTNCQWSSFIQVGRKNNIVNRFVFDAMCEYYSKHTHTVDYFLQNYCLRLAKENICAAGNIFEDIMISNTHLYDLSLCINTPFTENKWEDMLSDTKIFKLTYKVPYYEFSGSKPTFFGYIKTL